MDRKTILVLFAVLSAVCLNLLDAQNSGNVYGSIVYAEGQDFSIYRGGSLKNYSIAADDVFGMELLEGDTVLTEDATFIEIQLLPSGNLLKVAENTTFKLETLSSDGSGTFTLTYGRVRAKVSKLLGNERFSIAGRNAVAGVRGTDFGYDYVIERKGASEPSTKVYCFEGNVEVSAPAPAADTAEPSVKEFDPVLIAANEMVTVSNVPGDPNNENAKQSGTGTRESAGSGRYSRFLG